MQSCRQEDIAGRAPNTKGDHWKVSGAAYSKGMKTTLSRLSTQGIDVLDLSDDRFGHLLTHLSQPTSWHRIEEELKAHSIEGFIYPAY